MEKEQVVKLNNHALKIKLYFKLSIRCNTRSVFLCPKISAKSFNIGVEYHMNTISKSNWFRRGRFATYNKKNSTVKVKNWKMTTEYQLVKYN